jgi:uncharacterized damage-inducible protein DinB
MPSSLSVDAAREILAYDRRLYDRYLRKVRGLPPKAAFENRGIGHGTLFETLVHILAVHRGWFLYVVPGRLDELEAALRRSDWLPDDWREFAPWARRVWAGERAFVEGLTPKELRRTIRAPWMPGRYTVADAVLQVSFEEAHHVGEIIAVLNQRDAKLPDMTWIDVTRGRALR